MVTAFVFISLGKTFVTGVACHYSEYYDSERLSGYLSRSEFQELVNSINEILFTFWPCSFCFLCGYCLCPCTLGLSLLFPSICVSDAKEQLTLEIKKQNRKFLKNKNLELSLVIHCSTSWLELRKVGTADTVKQNTTIMSELCPMGKPLLQKQTKE